MSDAGKAQDGVAPSICVQDGGAPSIYMQDGGGPSICVQDGGGSPVHTETFSSAPYGAPGKAAGPATGETRGGESGTHPARAGQGPLPIPYTAEEVGRIFSAQLENFDFTEELRELGIGPLKVFTRRQGKAQFTALSVALWKLALARSFPGDAEEFFALFLEQSPLFAKGGKKSARLKETVLTYLELLTEKGDADFSVAAEHLVRSLKLSSPELPRYRLKLSLRIRALYSFIFDKLIWAN